MRTTSRRLRTAAAVAALAVIAAACDPNPEPEDACVLGANGGDPVIIVAGTFSPALANEAFLGNAIEAAGHTHCVFELKGDEDLGNLPGTQPIELSAGALALFVPVERKLPRVRLKATKPTGVGCEQALRSQAGFS